MEMPGTAFDKKLLLAMILVCLALGGGFALIYIDLKTDFSALRDDYANLSAQMEQLQGLIEALHHGQIENSTAVQIYNRTKHSVVLITAADRGGSGFVYDLTGEGGYIVTNNHVVDGSSAEITVTFLDGTVTQAQLIGGDVYSDLAVIKVNSLPEQSLPLIVGNSTQLMVGEPVYAIGNPFGLSSSMTAGIVSQVGRILRLGDLGVPSPWGNYAIVDVIQFDAAVNPGNSGGPLLNGLGFVVGVTFAIETTEGISAFIGIGYAIPSVLVKRVADSIIATAKWVGDLLTETGHYHHPWMGIVYDPNYVGGLLIESVNSSSPAQEAGLQPNDIIIKVDELPVNRPEDLLIYLERRMSPGDKILLRVVRDGNELEDPIELTLGERPA